MSKHAPPYPNAATDPFNQVPGMNRPPMTAETDLLPLPEIERWRVTGDYAYPTEVDPEGGAVDYDAHIAAMQSYARANVAHATTPLQSEIEALRAEVASAQQMTETVHEAMRTAVANEVKAEARAERLAEALRHQRWCRTCAEDGWESCEDGRKADALLNPDAAQENDDA